MSRIWDDGDRNQDGSCDCAIKALPLVLEHDVGAHTEELGLSYTVVAIYL